MKISCLHSSIWDLFCCFQRSENILIHYTFPSSGLHSSCFIPACCHSETFRAKWWRKLKYEQEARSKNSQVPQLLTTESWSLPSLPSHSSCASAIPSSRTPSPVCLRWLWPRRCSPQTGLHLCLSASREPSMIFSGRRTKNAVTEFTVCTLKAV